MNHVRECTVPKEELDIAREFVTKAGFEYGWRSHGDVGYAHWNRTYAGHDRLNRDDVEPVLLDPLIPVWKWMQAGPMALTPVLLRCYANANTYGTGGYPHVDSTEPLDVTAVLYLNTEWRREWGGETLLFHGNSIVSATMPQPGKGVIFPSSMWHRAAEPTRICPVARTVLVFKARRP